MTERFITNAKEILRDGRHFADMVDEAAVEATALVLNRAAMILPTKEESRVIREGLGL